MIFPIGDDQVENGHFPIVCYTFIGLNVVMFLYQLSVPGNMICQWGSIPNEIVAGDDYYTLFTSMFMHGGWMHLIGNLLFLWVFGDNIEATIGNFNFLVFYIMGGLAASAAHIYFNNSSELINCCQPCGSPGFHCDGSLGACLGSIPTVGASGSISAVLGAYLIMFPKSKVRVLVVYFFRSFYISAIWFLGFWIAQQLFSGFMSLGPDTAATAGVAWWAHIGGFFFGVIAGFFARDKGEEALHDQEYVDRLWKG